jgi:hypothetical protein
VHISELERTPVLDQFGGPIRTATARSVVSAATPPAAPLNGGVSYCAACPRDGKGRRCTADVGALAALSEADLLRAPACPWDIAEEARARRYVQAADSPRRRWRRLWRREAR